MSERERDRKRAVTRFRALPGPERRALLLSAPLLMLTRVLLRLFPVVSVKRWLHRLAQMARDPMDEAEALRSIPRAVTTASRHVPGGRHCLTKALVAWALLEAAGAPAELKAGLRRDPGGVLLGHAWLEREGQVVMDAGEDPGSFAPLVGLEEAIDDSG